MLPHTVFKLHHSIACNALHWHVAIPFPNLSSPLSLPLSHSGAHKDNNKQQHTFFLFLLEPSPPLPRSDEAVEKTPAMFASHMYNLHIVYTRSYPLGNQGPVNLLSRSQEVRVALRAVSLREGHERRRMCVRHFTFFVSL